MNIEQLECLAPYDEKLIRKFSQELSPPSSAQTPNSQAPTPTSGNPTLPISARERDNATPTSATSLRGAMGQKKNKKGEREEEANESRVPKRLKMTYSRAGFGS